MSQSQNDKEISSAEMTAAYRSAEPNISGDSLSKKLASPEGRKKAQDFIDNFSYKLLNRHMSVRANYMLNQSVELIKSEQFDSCISLASGFSLLVYYIAEKCRNFSTDIKYYDTDLQYIIDAREQRITDIYADLDADILQQINSMCFDIENAYKNNLKLKDIFPGCEKPIFIIEGIIYFLSEECVNWLLKEIASYDCSAIIIDIWQEDMLHDSKIFNLAYEALKHTIPEKTKSFWDEENMQELEDAFPYTSLKSLAKAEEEICEKLGIKKELLNKNEYFPVDLITASKVKITK